MAGVYAAQRVVGAKCQDNQIRLVRERPIEPRKPAGRRISGHPGIDDARLNPLLAEPRLQSCRKGLFGWQSVSRGQAVAYVENDGNVRTDGYCGRHQAERCGGQDVRHYPRRVENPW